MKNEEEGVDVLDTFMETGFEPTDDYDFGPSEVRVGRWIRERYVAIRCHGRGYLVTRLNSDEVRLVLLSGNGVTIAAMSFGCPDLVFDRWAEASFTATVAAWSKTW